MTSRRSLTRPSSRRAPWVLAVVFLALFACWWRGWFGGTSLDAIGWPWGWRVRGGVVLSEQTARDLAVIPVAEKSRQGEYRREAFGQTWADVDRNGCDTRNDILNRDLTAVTHKNSQRCAVASGLLADPYTGREIAFTAGTESRKVQIDHVVALADAWASGASGWDADARERMANDPENLLAVDGPTNQDKGADDAASWLPGNRDFRCPYVARQIRVKAKYRLSVTEPERGAMLKVLRGCPGFNSVSSVPDAPSPAAAGCGARASPGPPGCRRLPG